MPKAQPKLENAKIYSAPFCTMLQSIPQGAVILQEIPACFFATDHGNHYKMYRFFPNRPIPQRILEVGVIPKNNKGSDIYVY